MNWMNMKLGLVASAIVVLISGASLVAIACSQPNSDKPLPRELSVPIQATMPIQQDPDSDQVPSLQLPSYPTPIHDQLQDLPNPFPSESTDPSKDPLLKAIQNIMSEGNRPQLRYPGEQPALRTSDHSSSMSSARWHAMELILQAARLLEEDLAHDQKQADTDSLSKTKAMIRDLRTQASNMILK
jgi:hypothetical protein